MEIGIAIQIAELREIGQPIISEIVVFLIDAPIDPGAAEPFGIGGPAECGKVNIRPDFGNPIYWWLNRKTVTSCSGFPGFITVDGSAGKLGWLT